MWACVHAQKLMLVVHASTSVFMLVFLKEELRGRWINSQTAGHIFTPSAGSFSAEASAPHDSRNSWSCHHLSAPPLAFSTATWREAQWNRDQWGVINTSFICRSPGRKVRHIGGKHEWIKIDSPEVGGRAVSTATFKWREMVWGFQAEVQTPLLLALWLQFPLLYCNPSPGISYENTLSVGLERTLTSKGFSREAMGTLLNSVGPRQ